MNRIRRTGKARMANGGRASWSAKRLCAGRRAAITAAGEITCAFGATRVGTLLKRLRLHLATQRFLAECRGDSVWQAGCDDAGLTIERLGLGMHPRTLGARTVRRGRIARGGRR